jgi:hypothetical protein
MTKLNIALVGVLRGAADPQQHEDNAAERESTSPVSSPNYVRRHALRISFQQISFQRIAWPSCTPVRRYSLGITLF